MSRATAWPLLLVASMAGAQPGPGQQLSDIETQITREQRQLELLKARAARLAFEGSSEGTLPQIVSVYGAGPRARALLDFGGAGVREVSLGDVLGTNLVVTAIDPQRGVALRMGSAKSAATVHLSMKAPPTPTAAGSPTAPTGLPPGFPPVPAATLVPPLIPMPQR